MPALAVGCPAATTVEIDVPEAVTVAGLLFVDDNGQVVEGSALEPWRDSLPVLTQPGGRTLVVGYSDDQLAPYGPQLFSTDRLQAAFGCQNRLPAPAFAAYLTSDGWQPTDPAEVPAVTTAVVESTCPTTTSTAWAADVTCFGQLCTPVVTETGPCSVQLDLTACGAGRPVVTVDAAGQACLTDDVDPPECTAVTDAYADGALACGTSQAPCRVHVYREARQRPRPFSITRTQWKPDADATPTVLRERAWIAARYLRSGFAFDMILLDGTLVIAAPANVFSNCSTGPFEYTFIDPDSLEVTNTVRTKACTQVLVADPGGQTFVAAYFENDTWRVGRFDRSGAELLGADAVDARLAGARDASGQFVPLWRPSVLRRSPDGTELWLVMYDSVGFEPLPGAAFIRLDATTLRVIEQRTLEQWHRSYSGVPAGDEAYALLAEWSFSVGWFRLDRDVPDVEVRLPDDSLVRDVHYTVTPLSADRMLVAALGRSPALVVQRTGDFTRVSHPGGEPEQMMVRFLDWDGPIKLGIGLQTVNNGRREAIATLIDTQANRFLPGVWVLGDGLPSQTLTDALGRHFVVLPWTAELLRLDPN